MPTQTNYNFCDHAMIMHSCNLAIKPMSRLNCFIDIVQYTLGMILHFTEPLSGIELIVHVVS